MFKIFNVNTFFERVLTMFIFETTFELLFKCNQCSTELATFLGVSLDELLEGLFEWHQVEPVRFDVLFLVLASTWRGTFSTTFPNGFSFGVGLLLSFALVLILLPFPVQMVAITVKVTLWKTEHLQC